MYFPSPVPGALLGVSRQFSVFCGITGSFLEGGGELIPSLPTREALSSAHGQGLHSTLPNFFTAEEKSHPARLCNSRCFFFKGSVTTFPLGAGTSTAGFLPEQMFFGGFSLCDTRNVFFSKHVPETLFLNPHVLTILEFVSLC